MYQKYDFVQMLDWTICVIYDKYRPATWNYKPDEWHYSVIWINWPCILWSAITEWSIKCKVLIDKVKYTPIMTWKVVDVTIDWRNYKAKII